jgi:hypothetical protein
VAAFHKKSRPERDQIYLIVPASISLAARHRKTAPPPSAWPSRYDVRGNIYRIVSPQPFDFSTTRISPVFISLSIASQQAVE